MKSKKLKEKKMSDSFNVGLTVIGAVIIAIGGCITYYNVIDSNNTKEIVTKAIERGVDPLTAACATQIAGQNNGQARSTCEKIAIIKGK
jgi:hypothetical protein